MNIRDTISLIYLIISTAATVNGFSRGAPTAKNNVCEELKPSPNAHGEPQSSEIPFILEIDDNSKEIDYADTITLTLSQKSSNSPTFKGFMIQSRLENDEVIGEFLPINDEVKVIDCSNKIKSSPTGSVTHTSPLAKKSIKVQWKAGNNKLKGKTVKFYATVVEEIFTFWTKHELLSIKISGDGSEGDAEGEAEGEAESEPEGESESEPKAEGESEAEGEAESEAEGEAESEAEGEAESEPEKEEGADGEGTGGVTPPQKNVEIYSSCSEGSIGCFGNPNNCIPNNNCDVLATHIRATGNKYRIELRGKAQSNGYLAIGFSEDDLMGDDLVISCRNLDKKPIVQFSYNDGYSNSDLESDIPKIHNVNIINDEGSMICSFDIDEQINIKKPGSTDVVSYDFLKNSYRMLVAFGSTSSSFFIGKHAKTPSPSAKNVKLGSIEIVQGKSDLFVKFHGILMVLAWLCCASIGMILARYYKNTWKQKQFLNTPVWFFGHRVLMILTVILTAAATVLIIFDLGLAWKFSLKMIRENPHPVLGVCTIFLAFIQPLMAYLRPHPGTPRRWIFNVGHWFVGNAAYIIGLATIFLSVDLTKANIPSQVTYVLVAFVIIHCIIHLALSGQLMWIERNPIGNNSAVHPMHDKHNFDIDDPFEKEQDARGTKVRRSLFVVYVIVVIVVTLFMVGIISMGIGEF